MHDPIRVFWFCFSLAIVGMIFTADLYCFVRIGQDATLSRVVRACGERWPLLWPLLAFFAGSLFGHFFW